MEPDNEYDARLTNIEGKIESINISLLALNQKLDTLIKKERPKRDCIPEVQNALSEKVK